MRDLESDCDVTIPMSCRIYSNTNDTRSILVSILPYSRQRNSKMIEFIYVELVRDLESDCDVTIYVTGRISSECR